MKRFYLPVGITILATALALSAGAAAQSDWHPLNGKTVEKKAPVRPQLTPKEKHLEKIGAVNPNAKFQPIHDGLQRVTPAINIEPAYVMAKTIEAPRAHLYGVVSRYTAMTTAEQAFLAEINSATRAVTPKFYNAIYATSQGDSYVYQGGGYRNGKIYVPNLTQGAEGMNILWNEVDVATGEITNKYYYGADLNADAYSICYDNVNDVFYTLSFTSDSDSHLGMVDPKNNFKYTYLTHLGNGTFFAGLAYNPLDNRVYAFDDDINVYTINLRDYSVINAGQLDIDYSLFSPAANAAITFSPMDEAFICIFRDNSTSSNRLVLIDPDDFEVTDAGALLGKQDIFISALICTDDFAPAEAPELPVDITTSFDKANLSGSISFTVPTLTFYGVEIPQTTPVKVALKSDDLTIYEGNHHAGETVKVDVTLPQGLHNIEYTCAIADKVSPVRKHPLYVGYDNPAAPTNIRIVDDEISWIAPGRSGQHNGYVDLADMTFDVFFNDVKQNAAPINDTKFKFNVPETLALTEVKVVATSQGMASLPGTINFAIGKACELPYSAMPSQEESALFTTFNANNDAAHWFFTSKTGTSITGWACPMSYFDDNDDWLFLPMMHFDDINSMYEFSFDAASLYTRTSVESIEVCMGKHPSVESMDYDLFTDNTLSVEPTGTKVSGRFAVPVAGNYYIGIHHRSTKTNDAQGMFANNFLVQKLADSSSAVPANPQYVRVTPAAFGAKEATLTITLPTLDLIGNPLPSTQQISANVACGNYSGSASGMPGSPVDVTVRVPQNGINVFSVTLANANGLGSTSTYAFYVGIDRPMAPTNIRAVVADDNLSMQLSWDAPGEVGLNGGYVDTDALLYDIYMRNGVSYSRVGTTDKLTVKFEPTLTKMASYHVGPVARSEAGISEYSEFVQEVIGQPYELPILEEFNNTIFSVNPYSQKVAGEYTGSRWENIGDASGLGIGNANLIQGGVIAYSESGMAVPAKLTLPKFTTKGYDKLSMTVRMWDYSLAPTLYIYARSASNQHDEIIGRYNPKKPLVGNWVDYTFDIPQEYLGQGWVELAFRCSLRAMGNEYLLIDSWEVAPDVDNDFKIKTIGGPAQVTVGQKAIFPVTVVNSGQLRNAADLTVKLLTETGSEVDSKTMRTASLNSNMEYTANVEFEINGAFADSKDLIVRAEVNLPDDQIPNNNTRDAKVAVKQSQLPVVKILRQTSYDKETGDFAGRILSPNLSYGNFEDFELHTPFENTSALRGWKNVDLDGNYPVAIGSGNLQIRWDGYEFPCAWTVINPAEMGFANDERLNAHSGSQCIMARAGVKFDEHGQPLDDPVQASDWLISPEVKGGSQVSFWFNTIASDMTEYIEIWYSSEGTEVDPAKYPINGGTVCGDFVKLRPFHKVGTDVWEPVSFQLPEDAKYFAIVYTSFDSAACMIDDIEFTPANLNKWELDHYELWKSVMGGEPQLVDGNLTEMTFTDNVPADQRVDFWVYACVKDADGKILRGPKSAVLVVNRDIAINGIESISALSGILGSKGAIEAHGYAGHTLHIHSMDGALLKSAVPTSDDARIPMPKGIYIVSSGSGAAKVVVK